MVETFSIYKEKLLLSNPGLGSLQLTSNHPNEYFQEKLADPAPLQSLCDTGLSGVFALDTIRQHGSEPIVPIA